MPSQANSATAALKKAVLATVLPEDRLVLAVSGGRDSMALLDAVARWRPDAVAGVATFDHGTGTAARDAVELVRAAARRLGFPLAHGHAHALAPTEASWRVARWSFLRDTARAQHARVATAHTRNDQIETVFIRALRGAGPRGLAGLYAESDVVRPLLGITSATVAQYAAARGLPVADDPSNQSRKFLRNRVRLDLLPALEAAHPGFGDALLAISRRAAAWRASVERYVDGLGLYIDGRSVFVPAVLFAMHDERAVATLWPAIVARAGIALDRRGTVRLAEFIMRCAGQGNRRGRVQMAGGHEVVRHANVFEVRPAPLPPTTLEA